MFDCAMRQARLCYVCMCGIALKLAHRKSRPSRAAHVLTCQVTCQNSTVKFSGLDA
jgi:hypothetical protein